MLKHKNKVKGYKDLNLTLSRNVCKTFSQVIQLFKDSNIASWCYKRGLITLHSFPKDPKRRKEWESKVKKPNFMATNNHKICSQHFERECFEPLKTGGTWLKPDAVPTIFDLVMPVSLHKKNNGKKSSTKRKESGDESSTKRIIKNKRLCYLGDFDETTVITPENARKMLARAKSELVMLLQFRRSFMLTLHPMSIFGKLKYGNGKKLGDRI
ncbi:hypothetical protein JTE90_022741 [Oedothorax gibbosus]|uniref:THAP-type domain-containing protein n=1 Tax=Oedothorax gibbosus TaxID=931172 RepID=A0AAV6UQU0_9ARAC|nr:hypothetical protein JTE90_022741 [Oedothorax gibbosus]